jgi:hypothetical protein
MHSSLVKFAVAQNSVRVSETVGLRHPTRCIRDFAMFIVWSSSKNCRARFCSATDVVCRDANICKIKVLL